MIKQEGTKNTEIEIGYPGWRTLRGPNFAPSPSTSTSHRLIDVCHNVNYLKNKYESTVPSKYGYTHVCL